MTRNKKKGAKGVQTQMQWILICEAAKHGTYAFLQQCMAAHRLAQRANDYVGPAELFPPGAENVYLHQSQGHGVPPEIAQKLADKQARGLAKAHAGYRGAKETYINTVSTEARALYEEFRVCSREARSQFCPDKLKQMNLLLLIDTLLDKCAGVSIPLEWTPEWMCIRDSDVAQDATLKNLVHRAFQGHEINAFVQLLRTCAARLFPPLAEAWLPIYEEQSIMIYNKWRGSQLDKRTGRPKKTTEHFTEHTFLAGAKVAPCVQESAVTQHPLTVDEPVGSVGPSDLF